MPILSNSGPLLRNKNIIPNRSFQHAFVMKFVTPKDKLIHDWAHLVHPKITVTRISLPLAMTLLSVFIQVYLFLPCPIHSISISGLTLLSIEIKLVNTSIIKIELLIKFHWSLMISTFYQIIYFSLLWSIGWIVQPDGKYSIKSILYIHLQLFRNTSQSQIAMHDINQPQQLERSKIYNPSSNNHPFILQEI